MRCMKKVLLAALSLFLATAAFAGTAKTFRATYTATINGIPEGTKEVIVWVPLPTSKGPQAVRDLAIDSPYEWVRHRDAVYGNEYAVAKIANPPEDLTVPVRFTAVRQEAEFGHPYDTKATARDRERELAANKLVTLSPRVRKLAEELTAGKKGTIEQARAIYDYLVVTMKYDKTIPGWGKGDTERACDIKAGNCTDFHSLFISLARAKGIPARFVIGFPLTAKDGLVKGYHCWAEFWDGKAWIPVDASEASKSNDPKLRAFLFGNLDADRVQFTMGRDLVLKPKTSEPLNYFIYPHAEVAGEPVGAPSIELKFEEIRATAAALAPAALPSSSR
jgi:transglutaminase-like putative cysteine protease